MSLHDKKYRWLVFTGIVFMLISIVMLAWSASVVWIILFGFSVGWITMIFVFRFMVAYHEAKHHRNKSEELLEEIRQTFEVE